MNVPCCLIVAFALCHPMACAADEAAPVVEIFKRLQKEVPRLLIYRDAEKRELRLEADSAPVAWLIGELLKIDAENKAWRIEAAGTADKNQEAGMLGSGRREDGEEVRIILKYPKGLTGTALANCLWSRLVFEIGCRNQEVDLDAAIEAFQNGKLAKREFVMRLSRHYFAGARRTRLFFERTWKPWATDAAFELDGTPWFRWARTRTFEDWHMQQEERGTVVRWEAYADRLSARVPPPEGRRREPQSTVPATRVTPVAE